MGPDGAAAVAAVADEPAGAAAGAAAAVVSAVWFAFFPPPHAPSANAVPINTACDILMMSSFWPLML